MRKLKFQYLEQNAKDRYVKSIVSDIDDAPIVTAEDVKELNASNEEKKAKLKEAKTALAEMHHNIRTLTPLVQEDYDKTKAAIDKATLLAQKIIDARLALTRLRQTHPHPRLTIAAADQKLAEQVTEMQELSDKVEAVRKQVQTAKEELKTGNVELENIRAERAEAEKLAKNANVGEDDPRIAPLYDWCILISLLSFEQLVAHPFPFPGSRHHYCYIVLCKTSTNPSLSLTTNFASHINWTPIESL